MGKIRKKTSKRGTTHEKVKRKHQIKESKRKVRKAAKKSPQWKSKTPKDPGIPNNFPYKDEILAEIAEERRLAAESKERKKEERKAIRAKAKAGPQSDDSESEGEGSANEASTLSTPATDAFNGILSLSGGSSITKSKKDKSKAATVEDEDEVEDPPALVNPDLPNLQSVLDKADVVIELLDARDPMSYRSSQLEGLVAGKGNKKLLFVLNKIDMCPREPLAAWASFLRSSHPTLLFRSSSAFISEAPSMLDPALVSKSKGKAKAPADDAWGEEAVLSLLKQWAEEKENREGAATEPLQVAVIGVTNSGKSAFINSLVHSSAFPTYSPATATTSSSPTTTLYAQETTLTLPQSASHVTLIDTPGVSWQPRAEPKSEEAQKFRAHDILVRSRGRVDKMKDPVPAVEHIVSRSEPEDLMLVYNLPAFSRGDTSTFLSGVARSSGFLKKGGVLDLTAAARIVLRDWSTGKLQRISMPPTSSKSIPTVDELANALSELYTTADSAVLSQVRTKKEMRKADGLVKMASGTVDERELELEKVWVGLEPDSEEEDEDEDEDAEGEDDLMDVDETEAPSGEEDPMSDDMGGDEEEEEENEEPTPPPSPKFSKRKRPSAPTKSSSSAGPPSKKVAFSNKPLPPSSSASASTTPKSRAEKRGDRSSITTPSEQPKSALKSSTKPSKVSAKGSTKAAGVKRAVANAPSKKAAGVAVAANAAGSGGGDAYDFGKFF
ncbi:uncharacterized protein STEHIDRAFT_169483 [Stereum hirsutum FP-91666 SS1]|uniref:uncharacterized protein n=1 Tax=Stereum hirsutum (strain FP-91666) TaxID=721885 RepID=UPI000444A44E|nr:uncharacterized protein STEHIDRAFT_169483 [Stereum hirsutum FP-91666 SS1]EIM85608.1 hypothetical protein STEHIDRAFT_169483 [Stereum hirsutum FP-91666 SS1]